MDQGPKTAGVVPEAGSAGRIDSQITLWLLMSANATPLASATRVVRRYGALHGS